MVLKSEIFYLFIALLVILNGCKKAAVNNPVAPTPPIVAETFQVSAYAVNGNDLNPQHGANLLPVFKLSFSAAIDKSSIPNAVSLTQNNGTKVSLNVNYQGGDSILLLQPGTPLNAVAKYVLDFKTILKSAKNTPLASEAFYNFSTAIDSSDKYPLISDSALLDKVQQQTFNYFWSFGHPVSGMARERNSSGDLVTSGGTGFGVMAIVTAVNRGFITRPQGAARILLITNFLKDKCTQYHGAFAHWINGANGQTIPFSTNDNGADIVETAYLMQGLITARQYFNTNDAAEINLRATINILWNGVDWNWFRQGNQNVLTWHWSPDKAFLMNDKVTGWNEALITYVLAAASPTNAISKAVYDSGWANNGGEENNKLFYGYTLPLGPDFGGPLFFEHYSFLGINPAGLQDKYANYQVQTTNHTLINQAYCTANPKHWYGYSNTCWGLTASDVEGGYNASAPNNDVGVITPAAAISSMPYTPLQSMNALKFFYYKLGDKLWGEYGFYDAFNLNDPWFATSALAIDEGPIIIMIENYRTGLLWNLFSNAPEIKTGLKKLGFTAPYL